MKLFEGHFQQRDGEHEYTSKRQVVAPDINVASEFFSKALEVWFGEETEVEDRYSDGTVRTVVNAIGYPMVRMDWVAQVVVDAVAGTDGNMYHIMHEVVEEN